MSDTKKPPDLLKPKLITEEKIYAARHNSDEHIGKSENVRDLLIFLLSMKAFGPKVKTPSQVADLMYAPSSLIRRISTNEHGVTEVQISHYGNRRLEKVRFGRASLTTSEGRILHQAFRRVIGESADAVTMEELILEPLSSTMAKLFNNAA